MVVGFSKKKKNLDFCSLEEEIATGFPPPVAKSSTSVTQRHDSDEAALGNSVTKRDSLLEHCPHLPLPGLFLLLT